MNLSGSGASVSFGTRGFWYTVGSKGTRTTASLPGTGLSWSHYKPHRRSETPAPNPDLPAALPQSTSLAEIESAPVSQIAAQSTSELVPLLQEITRRYRLWPLSLVAVAALSAVAIHVNKIELLRLMLIFGAIAVPFFWGLDRYRLSLRIRYDLNQTALGQFQTLKNSADRLAECSRIWHVRAEGTTYDWKRNAGANLLVDRKEIRPRSGLPACIRSNIAFPSLELGKERLYFAPDSVLVVTKRSVAILNYRDLLISESATRFIEEGRVPQDAEIVDETWRYVNKRGGPDRRFGGNRLLPVCRYGEMNLRSKGGLNERIQYSDPSKGAEFRKAIEWMQASDLSQKLVGQVEFTTARSTFAALSVLVLFVAGAGFNVFQPADFRKSDRSALAKVTPSEMAVVMLASVDANGVGMSVVLKGGPERVAVNVPLPRARPRPAAQGGPFVPLPLSAPKQRRQSVPQVP